MTKRTVEIKTNVHGPRFSYPGSESIAKIHSKAFRVGDQEDNYIRKCECCGRNIPTKFYQLSDNLCAEHFFVYGIELAEFLILIKRFYVLPVAIFLSYIWQTLLSLIFYNFPEYEFHWIYTEFFMYYVINPFEENSSKDILDAIMNVVRVICILVIYIKITKKLRKAKRRYEKIVLQEVYADESVYGVTVHNLPKVLNEEEFLHFLKHQYNITSVKEIVYFKDVSKIVHHYHCFYELTEQRKTMEVTHYDEKFLSEDFTSLDSIILRKKEKLKTLVYNVNSSPQFSGSAVIILENYEDKSLLLEKNLNIGTFLAFFRASNFDTFRGRKLFFENTMPFDYLKLGYHQTSLTKMIYNTYVNSILAIGIYLVASLLIFLLQFKLMTTSHFYYFDHNIYKIPFLKAIFILVVNYILKHLLLYLLSYLPFSDKYYQETVSYYLIFNKTIFASVVLGLLTNLNTYNQMDYRTEYLALILFLILLCFKSLLLTRFNTRYLKHTLYYIFDVKIMRRQYVQHEMNELYSDNIYLIFDVWGFFKVLVYSSMLYMRIFPLTSTFILVIVLLLSKIAIYSLYHSCLLKQNPFGYFLTKTLKFEIINLLIIFVAIGLVSTVWFNNWVTSKFVFCLLVWLAMDLNNILQFTTVIRKFTFDKTFSDVQHTMKRTFKLEKFVNLALIQNEIN